MGLFCLSLRSQNRGRERERERERERGDNWVKLKVYVYIGFIFPCLWFGVYDIYDENFMGK